MQLPNADHIELDYLHRVAATLVEAGHLDAEVYSYEPESVVFTSWEPEDVEAILEVGARDVAAKIRYWRRILADVEVSDDLIAQM